MFFWQSLIFNLNELICIAETKMKELKEGWANNWDKYSVLSMQPFSNQYFQPSLISAARTYYYRMSGICYRVSRYLKIWMYVWRIFCSYSQPAIRQFPNIGNISFAPTTHQSRDQNGRLWIVQYDAEKE